MFSWAPVLWRKRRKRQCPTGACAKQHAIAKHLVADNNLNNWRYCSPPYASTRTGRGDGQRPGPPAEAATGAGVEPEPHERARAGGAHAQGSGVRRVSINCIKCTLRLVLFLVTIILLVLFLRSSSY